MNTDALNKIVKYLRDNNVNDQADILEDLSKKYYSGDKEAKIYAIRQFREMCHPKWLGDYYIQHISQKDWYGLIESLRKSL